MAVEYSSGYTSGGAEGVCVFGAWVGCDEDSCKQEMERVLVGRWRHGLEDMDMQAHRVILNRLQWRTPGRRFVSGSAPGNTGLSDIIKVSLSASFSVPPSLHDDLATVAWAKVREVLP
jgi:hypothetical protein